MDRDQSAHHPNQIQSFLSSNILPQNNQPDPVIVNPESKGVVWHDDDDIQKCDD